MAVLEIDRLTKHYGRITAVNQLSLSVPKGSIYGILGPNGSGKTTTLGIILGITNRDGGSYRWFEGQYAQDHIARRRVGALLETPNFYPYLSAVKNLEIVAAIKRVSNPDIDEALRLVNLYDRRNYAFKTYSLGMKQRLAIAAAMIGDPDVLIFDEPTNGLDPQGIAEVRETIREIGRREKTILMASHILDEVEKVCTHVAIIKNGVLLSTGTVDSIINGQIELEVSSEDNQRLYQVFNSHPAVTQIIEEDGKLILSLSEGISPAEFNALAFQNNITLNHLVNRKRSLEAEFLAITQQQ